MKAKNQFSLASKYWLLILAIICIILMGLSGFADTGKGPLAWVAGYTVVPMQKGINRVGMWISDVSDNFATLQEVREENKQLKEKVAELTIENNQLQQNSAELERLQELSENPTGNLSSYSTDCNTTANDYTSALSDLSNESDKF